MKIELQSTQQIIYVNGTPNRVWKGFNENGIKIIAFISQIGIPINEDRKLFDEQLMEIESKEIAKTPFQEINVPHFISKYPEPLQLK